MASSADFEQVLAIEDRGVSVEKRFDTEQFEYELSVRFTITSSHNEPLLIKLIDQVPDGLTTGNFGFLPEYHGDSWDVYNDSYPTFDYVIEPGETIETMYAVSDYDDFSMESFIQKPQLVDATPTDTTDVDSDGAEDAAGGEQSSAASGGLPKDVTTTGESTDTDSSADTTPSEQREDAADSDASTERTNTDDSNTTASGTQTDLVNAVSDTNTDTDTDTESVAGTPDDTPIELTGTDIDDDTDTATDTDTDTDTPAPPTDSDAHDTLTAALVAELNSGTVSDDTQQALAEQLAPYLTDTATTVRLDALQSTVADLDAYTDALEAFLNDTGTVEDITDDLSRLDKQLDALDDRIGALEADNLAAANNEQPDDIEDTLAELKADINDLQTWQDNLSNVLGE